MQEHKYSLTELENMIAWERDIYLGLLEKYISEKNEEAKKQIEIIKQEKEKMLKVLR